MDKYHEALEQAIAIVEFDLLQEWMVNRTTITPIMERRRECADRLIELQRLLDIPQLKQSLKELDLEGK